MLRNERTTQRLLIFIAMRRSGHHALVHFIYRMFDAPKRFCNNRKSARKKFQASSRDLADGDIRGDLELFMVNYEDQRVGMSLGCPRCLIQGYASLVGQALDSNYLLSMRDPFNLFASRLNQKEGRIVRRDILHNPGKTIETWKNHAREFTGRTRFLPNLVTINYNEWVRSEEYRKGLAERLGLRYEGEGWNRTTAEGGASTFDRNTIEKADDMKLLERWKVVEDDPVYRRLFQDRELIDLSEEIFGRIPGTEELYP